ncbi:MAG: Spy/CpxP family protein refolding chaperone [Alcanivorax sp.]|jgi:Spy/CpxP family protein refolding chaperone|nr:MAG: hypothetical protein COA68_16535 [Oceanobacter sp.]|tara:strand:- start:4314 stop:4964 length:651 start_codon:yes stop_codon:yes gene_type:complete
MRLPGVISHFQRSLSLVACGVLMTTAQAWGFDERQQKTNWEDSLQLTEEQQKQIDAIEDRYRDSFKELKPSEAAMKDRREKRETLYVQMREEIRGVLSDEQQALAEEQVRRRESNSREDHLDKLARELSLSEDQRAQLDEKLSQCKKEEWPVDKAQRDADRGYFEKTVTSVLTDEQKEQWKALREKRRDKWSQHGMDKLAEDKGKRKPHPMHETKD